VSRDVATKHPVQWDDDVAAELLMRMTEGESCLKISRDFHMPTTATIWQWNQEGHGAPASFKSDYAKCRMAQADGYANQVLELADLLDERTRQTCEDAVKALPDDATPQQIRRAMWYAKKRSGEATKEMISARKWTSARMHPRNWGDKVAVEHSTDPDNPPSVNLTNMTDEQLEKIAALEEELGGGTGSKPT
jgi:hypothetical protein